MSDDQPIEVGRLDPVEWLGRSVKVLIDRPLGSQHPDGGFVYELNYGFVPGYIAPDGEELDAYVIGPDVPLTEVAKAIRFQERFFTSRVVVRP